MKWFLLIFMAVLADNATVIADGDGAFYRVDTSLPPHELPAGTAADAVNKRFENGRAIPRFGANAQPWGELPAGFEEDLVPDGAEYSSSLLHKYTVVNWTPGATYIIEFGANETTLLIQSSPTISIPREHTGQQVEFVAPSADKGIVLIGSAGSVPVTAKFYKKRVGKLCGYARFNDPSGFDTQCALTDDWRDTIGGDGGRGRVFRIQCGNVPVEISLNGHDVWDTSRLIPCHNGLTLLRHGDERHYFSDYRKVAITDSSASADTLTCDATVLTTGDACTLKDITGDDTVYYLNVASATTISLYDTAAHAVAGGATGLYDVTADDLTGVLYRSNIDPTNSRILLNAAQDWNDGDLVIYNPAQDGSAILGTSPPNPNTRYHVKTISGTNNVELYADAALSTKMVMTSAQGKFYLQRAADVPGFYGNVAPPLLAQASTPERTLWDDGFDSVPVNLEVTASDADEDSITVPNHRLVPGDEVTVVLSTDGTLTDKYVYPLSTHKLALYSTADEALANDPDDRIDITVASQTGTVTKSGASGLPMPGGREGFYADCNRLVIVNGRDTLAISDPLDPLHFTPFQAAVTANLGESDPIQALVSLGSDTFLVLKQNSVHVFNNLSQGPDNWTLTTLTREYGCIAPLSVAQVGADVWFLSRKGVASIRQTEQGVLQGTAQPVSTAMKKYIEQIDWRYAAQAAAGYWNSRYFVAVPLKGQKVADGIQNNGVLSHNFIYSMNDGETFGWEGLWRGDALNVFAFARHNVFGDDRLCWMDYAGQVHWFGDGFTDGATPIADSLLTRRYAGGNALPKNWLACDLNLDTYGVNLTVTAVFPGVNETRALATNKTFDKTKYGVYGAADYNPAASTKIAFNAPYRDDYEMSAGELLTGTLDTHQNHPLPLRMRRMDWGVQILIENTAGSARVLGVDVAGTQRTMNDEQRV